jgi:hypothetical protein
MICLLIQQTGKNHYTSSLNNNVEFHHSSSQSQNNMEFTFLLRQVYGIL